MLLPGWAPGDLAAALKVFINLLLKVRAGARLAFLGLIPFCSLGVLIGRHPAARRPVRSWSPPSPLP